MNGASISSGGLTMGTNQNITLASTFTAPTAGQLGYTTSVSVASLTMATTYNIYAMCNLSLGVGVWIVNYGSNLYPAATGSSNILYYNYQLCNGSTFLPTNIFANSKQVGNNVTINTTYGENLTNAYTTVITTYVPMTLYLIFTYGLTSGQTLLGKNMFISATRIA